MSEAMTRETDGALASARRTASHSVTLLKAAAGFGRSKTPEPEPIEAANETEPSAPPRPAPSVISANTEMKGSIATSDDLHIQGKIEGDIRAAEIMVCATGAVKGDLAADTINVYGAVEGRINGAHVRLHAGAVVKGEITHGTLGVDTAAVFEGSVKRMTLAAE